MSSNVGVKARKHNGLNRYELKRALRHQKAVKEKRHKGGES